MPTHFQLSWVRAVKEWNQHQAFHEDIYAIPKKGGDSYKEVVSLREEFKRQHNAPPVSEKKAEAVAPSPSAEPPAPPKIESPKKENVGPKKKIDMSQVKEEAKEEAKDALAKYDEPEEVLAARRKASDEFYEKAMKSIENIYLLKTGHRKSQVIEKKGDKYYVVASADGLGYDMKKVTKRKIDLTDKDLKRLDKLGGSVKAEDFYRSVLGKKIVYPKEANCL